MDGIDPEAANQYKAKTGSVTGMPNTTPISNEAILELNVEVLIPAALENVITEKNAHKVNAKIVAELANGCLLYTSPSPRDGLLSRMPSSA